MKVVSFEECNTVYAKNQPEYLNLPAHRSNTSDGVVTSCWKLSVKERLIVLFTGRLFLQVMTFNKPLQPLKMALKNPVIDSKKQSGRLPGPLSYPKPVNDRPVG